MSVGVPSLVSDRNGGGDLHLCYVRNADELRRRGIGYDVHYPIVDSDQVGWRHCGRIVGSLEVSRNLTTRVTSLPCFAELTADELDQVLDAIHAFS